MDSDNKPKRKRRPPKVKLCESMSKTVRLRPVVDKMLELDVSYSELSRRLGIRRQSMENRFKNDDCKMSDLEDMAKALGCNIVWTWRKKNPSGDELTEEQYYRHFRNGKVYRFVTYATIEATEEEAVVYQAMYGERKLWIRPKANFFEEVEYDGKMVPRFQPISEEEALKDIE